MLYNIIKLTGIHLKGSLGLANIHSKDDKLWRKSIGMLGVYIILAVLAVSASILISNTIIALNVENYLIQIPSILLLVSSILVFAFTIFRAGVTIYNLKMFEMEVVLPFTPKEIVCSRFLELYLFNIFVGIFLAVPGMIIAGMHAPFSLLYVVMSILGILFMPLIPLTLSAIVGGVLYAISVRIRQRKLINLIFGMIIFLVFFCLYFFFISSHSQSENTTIEVFSQLLTQHFSAITGWYIPVVLFSAGILGNVLAILGFIGISIVPIFIVIVLISWKYFPLCQAMQAHDAKHNYVMTSQIRMSQSKALFRHDFKRYISSTVYVFNTLIGYILMVVFAVYLAVTQDKGIFGDLITTGQFSIILPIVLVFLSSMSSTTPASISIEGKNWWLMQTLPIHIKDLIGSKLKVNFVVAFPFYLISVIIILIAFPLSIFDILAVILLPLSYIYFMTVVGMKVGIKHPNFSWSNEVEVVKRSSSTLISLGIAFGSVAIITITATILSIVFDRSFVASLVLCLFSLIVGGIGYLLHRSLNKIKLTDIC